MSVRRALTAFLLLVMKSTPLISSPLPAKVDRGPLLCTYMIMVIMTDYQKHCHPGDQDFGAALDASIRRIEKFSLANEWVDKKTIDQKHANFDKLVSEMKIHPIRTAKGITTDICKNEDIELGYQKARKSEAQYQQAVAKLLAHPPLMKTPYGTPCM